jgi:hypothetical protein
MGTIPETIRDLLSAPPLLDHENDERFLKLFDSFRAYAEPENVIDYHLVFNATVCNGKPFAIASWPRR